MSVTGKGIIYIDPVDFWSFVDMKSDLPEGAEKIFGKPEFKDNEVRVPVAFSSNGDPVNTPEGIEINETWNGKDHINNVKENLVWLRDKGKKDITEQNIVDFVNTQLELLNKIKL